MARSEFNLVPTRSLSGENRRESGVYRAGGGCWCEGFGGRACRSRAGSGEATGLNWSPIASLAFDPACDLVSAGSSTAGRRLSGSGVGS